MSYGYDLALRLAGAEILAKESFGSYQGDAWFKISYQGTLGWLKISYGSCGGCDSFASRFEAESHWHGEDEYVSTWDFDSNSKFDPQCSQCVDLMARLVAFGKSYLEGVMTQEEAEADAGRNVDWDMEAEGMLNFIRENSIPPQFPDTEFIIQ